MSVSDIDILSGVKGILDIGWKDQLALRDSHADASWRLLKYLFVFSTGIKGFFLISLNPILLCLLLFIFSKLLRVHELYNTSINRLPMM